MKACGVESACGSPGAARRVIEFRAREIATAVGVNSACDEHLAVGQQRRRVKKGWDAETAGGRPASARRIVEFRTREFAAGAVKSTYDEHLADGQQRRRVNIACGGEAAGGRPGPARRAVEFGARVKDISPCNKDHAVL